MGLLYLRLTGTPVDIYNVCEKFYDDYRKLNNRKMDGFFELIHMDEFVHRLLNDERVCETILPRIPKR